MKRTLTLALLLAAFQGFAQPQAINYQAVARNAAGQVIPSQNIAVRFSVLDSIVTGTTVYQETQTATTNAFGLFTMAIGNGTATVGTLANVNWGGNNKYLKVEIAPDGSSNYTLQNTTQMLSVPYALYAGKTKLIGGNGINITNGNTISATTGSNFWNADPNGIYYSAGKVGIGTTPDGIVPLSVFKANSGNGNAVGLFSSNDTWHTGIVLRNTTSNNQYTMVVGGSNNTESRPGNFGIHNGILGTWAMIVEGATNNIGIGSAAIQSVAAKSRLHVFGGDVNIDQIGSGIIMKSPNGSCWRITIDNTGNLVRTAITCP